MYLDFHPIYVYIYIGLYIINMFKLLCKEVIQMKIGVISDTHGLLRNEVIDNLKGCEYIIHAGDIGNKDIIERLKEIGKIIMVRGNNDNEEWTHDVPKVLRINIEGIDILIIHELKKLSKASRKADLIISGHSHRYFHEAKENVIFLNPGSCGKRRFSLPLTMATIDIDHGNVIINKVEIGG